MSQDSDREITLGTGKLLVLFFGLVVVCAIFFSLGYALGKNSGAQGTSLVPESQAATVPDANKPAAGAPVTTTTGTPATGGSNELTFYKSVGQNDANAKLTQPAAEQAKPAETQAKPAAETKPAETTVPQGTGYLVQVAAVSKQQDAEALVDALHKKQYPAFIADNSGDKLFHVQVGPFASLQDAESMKTRLLGDGYNPMVKR